MKINGREVHGRKCSSNSSINSFSKNISNSNKITQMNNLNRDIVRDFSRSKGQQNAKFEQTFSKIILILVFGPMILNLVISIISALFFGIAN
mgnify:CR=1 FL=1